MRALLSLQLPRRCAECRREFKSPTQYMSSGTGGIICRSRKDCKARKRAGRVQMAGGAA
jgi:hypothetical protein